MGLQPSRNAKTELLPAVQDAAPLIDLAYEAALRPELWTEFLGGINRRVKANAACMFLHDFADSSAQARGPDFSISALHGFDPRAWQDYIDHYCTTNVWARNEDQLQPGRAVTSSMLYPDDQLMRTEYGNDWLRPQDLFYAVGGILDRAGTVAMKFSFVRPQRYGPFDNQALALWQTLVPHVQRAADLHRRLMMAERRAGDAESTLDLLSEGVLLLRADGTVLHANPSAAALLGAHKGLGLDKDGKLLAAEPAARKALAAELHAALNPGALPPAAAFQPRLLSLRGLKGRLELSFNALPLRSERTPVRAAAAVFIVDPDAAPPDLAAGLGVLWHLTAAETALTCDLVGGLTVQQHADARGIALTTARSHLRTASAKLGIKRQADLVRVVLAHLQILRRR